MRQAALRTLLVVSERPHPWAFLRDRLDPDLVTVAWARPVAGAPGAAPWMLAGDASEAPSGLGRLRDHLLCWRWIGPPPDGLPAAPVPCADWQALAAEAERGLGARVAGLRLAPGRGLILPDGAYLRGAPALEALVAAHPGGVPVGAPTPRLRAAVRRAGDLLRRHELPLCVAHDSGRVALMEVG
jgi:hypothetical protein